MNFWKDLPKPFFVLAPMDDVTDIVFRQLVAQCSPPDVFFTEFASVDGFQSAGRQAVAQKLKFGQLEQPLVAQIWGLNPKNFEKTAQELAKTGFTGIDLNMGCPVKKVIKLGACAALMGNRELAHDIIVATQKGAGGLPVSIKTRPGSHGYDESWIRFLLEHHPAALTIHFRSTRELSKVDAHWDLAPKIIKLRDELSPKTMVIGNGDVSSRANGQILAAKYQLDGIMIGRAIFQDPYIFSRAGTWKQMGRDERLALFKRHIELFEKEWGNSKNPAVLKKFAKIYVNGFNGAKELREKIMSTQSTEQILNTLID